MKMILFVIAATLAGCSRDSSLSPTAPTAGTSATITVTQIRAYVSDTAYRSLVGAQVEVLDGSGAGRIATANADGVAVLNGVFEKGTRFRATIDGHESLIETWTCSVANCQNNATPWLSFILRPLATPLELGGEYMMTITADPTCAASIQPFQSRSYPVTLSKRFRDNTTDLLGYDVTVNDANVLGPVQHFFIGVAGNYLRLVLSRGDGDVPGLIAQVDTNAYVMVTAWSVGAASQGTTIALGFSGSIEYMVTRTPLTGELNEWFVPISPISRQTCAADEHRLTLVRMSP